MLSQAQPIDGYSSDAAAAAPSAAASDDCTTAAEALGAWRAGDTLVVTKMDCETKKSRHVGGGTRRAGLA